jgi:CubicO group peptidase (beta-lactamase class C family)
LVSDLNRRQVLGLGALALAATAPLRIAEANPSRNTYASTFGKLDQYVEQYMKDMYSPGMTMVLADRDGVQRVATYGFGDMETHSAVKQDELFHIGSISKSFTSLCLLQLHDEEKLDLQRPIADYLPWLRIETVYAPITVHHLMTHGSGLPGESPIFPADPNDRHRATHAPGAYFHYNNMAWGILGMLAETLDGQELPAVFRKRILGPLGMSQTEPVITLDTLGRTVKSYSVFQNDRPTARNSRVAVAPSIIMTSGAGCVASTARDMGAYVQMIARGGVGPKGPLVSADSFKLFSTAHIKAEEFGPTASYGYGIAVDTLDGAHIVRHTGGMVSFMSSIYVDIDNGVGAFASINAMLGYRPVPVTEYAVKLMRAKRDGKPLPTVPPRNPITSVPHAGDYVGTYQSAEGRSLTFATEGESLFLQHNGQRIALHGLPDEGQFACDHEDFAHFALVFSRKDSKVTEVGWGSDIYFGTAYTGTKKFDHPAQWTAYLGHYRNDDPWIGSARVVLRQGQLWLNGNVPLEQLGDRFYLRDEEHSPEWVSFEEVVNGKCMRIKLSGVPLWRVSAI